MPKKPAAIIPTLTPRHGSRKGNLTGRGERKEGRVKKEPERKKGQIMNIVLIRDTIQLWSKDKN